MRAALAQLEVEIVTNPSWQQGMGTSARSGLTALENTDPHVDAALLMVCDQPLIDRSDLERLIDAFQAAPAENALAAAKYNGTIGVPAIFGRAHFDALRALPDDGGAKGVLLAQRAAVIEVAMPNAAMDVDTREQYEGLIRRV